MKKNTVLKAALLSCCVITSSGSAISGVIPEIAKQFPDFPLRTIELVSTISSISGMIAIFLGRFLAQKIGSRNNLLLGALITGISGILPLFFPDIVPVLLSRVLFGIGSGLISSTLLALIIFFFEGKERSTVLGLQGSVGGFGSMVLTFLVGKLLTLGWNYTFLTYLLSFAVAAIIFFFVPDVRDVGIQKKEADASAERRSLLGYFGWALLLFCGANLVSLFMVKLSTLVTTLGYGTAVDGSNLLAILCLGSVFAAFYGSIKSKIGALTLPVFYFICGICYLGLSRSSSLLVTGIFSVIFGFANLCVTPYIQEKIADRYAFLGQKGTDFLLITNSLAFFGSPYFGSLVAGMGDMRRQMFIYFVLYMILTGVGTLLYLKERNRAH